MTPLRTSPILTLAADQVLASADLRADLAREGYQLDACPDGHPRVYRPRDVAEGLGGVPRVGSYCVARLVGRERARDDATADTVRPPAPEAA